VDISAVAAVCDRRSNEEKVSDGHRPPLQTRLDALLFGETQSRVVITCNPLDAVKVVERAKLLGVPAAKIGTVGGDRLAIKTNGVEFSATPGELHDAWWNAIARAMA
jgi:phosphoribosylformylglycinamidine synthase